MSERRRAILALLLVLPASSLGAVIALKLMPGPTGNAIYFLCKLHILLLPVLWWCFVERQRVTMSPMRRGGLGVGIGSGLVILASILGVYAWLGDRIIDPEKLRAVATKNGLADRSVYIVLAVYWSFVNSILEEYVWRWFVYTRCRALMGVVPAALVTAVGFTIHHFLALEAQFGWTVTVLGSVGVFVGSLWWSWCYHRYHSVWPGYACHICADLAVFGIGWVLLFP